MSGDSKKSVVLLFAGQGAQGVGMGRSLAEAYPCARELLEKADAVLGYALSQVMFEGPEEELMRTAHCQPALYVHGLMGLAILKQEYPELRIEGAAGLSLGEFTAHAAGGTFTFEEGLRLVAQRGQFMEEACATTEGSMAAMIGGNEEAAVKLAEKTGVDVANFNAPGQIVLSGPKKGIADAIAGARDAGFRTGKELKVAGAYHSRLMKSAEEKLKAVLETAEIGTPAFPVVSNLTAQPAEGAQEIRETLVAQVTGSVRWADSMEFWLGHGQHLYLELGPGKVLTGLMGRIRKDVHCFPTGEIDAMKLALEALA